MKPHKRDAAVDHWLGRVANAQVLLAARINQARREHPDVFRRYFEQAASSAEPFLCQPDPSSQSEDAAWLEIEPLYAAHRSLQSAFLLLGGLSRRRLRQLLDAGDEVPDRDVRRIHQEAILGALEECRTRDRR